MTITGKRILVVETSAKEKKSKGGILLTPEKTDFRTPVIGKIQDYDKVLTDEQYTGFENNVGDDTYVMYMPGAGIVIKQVEDTIERLLTYEEVLAVLTKDEANDFN